VPGPIDDLRAVVGSAAAAPEPMRAYLDKVHTRAYAITDADVEALKAAGLTEDEIFEQTVAVAIAEGLHRLDVAERVLSRRLDGGSQGAEAPALPAPERVTG
jgi:alkylhydroperoxidase family enzyme